MEKKQVKSFTEFTESKQTELFNKYGVFFAFSQTQFDERKKEGVSYVSLGGGLIIPKENSKLFSDEFNKMVEKSKEEYLKEYSRKEIIWMQLGNHEAGYTMSWGDAFEAVKHLGITKEEVQAEFRPWLNYQIQFENI